MAKEIKEIKEQKLNVRIKDDHPFYSNEASINFNPNEFIFDFKCLTQTYDLASQQALVINHSVIILNPYHVKAFADLLSKVIKDYEDKFAEIKKPEPLKKAEKLVKDQEKKIQKSNQKSKKEDEEGLFFG
jgi:hypothetical protein